MRQADAAAAHTIVPHSWVKPPPGTGTIRVCSRCGIRENRANPNASCPGKPVPHVVVKSDYDPYE